MKRQSFIVLFLVLVSMVLFGCGDNTTNSAALKPLDGIVIQRVEISGDQPQTVATAISAELLANGAKMATQANTPGAIVLQGTCTIEMVTNLGVTGPKLLKLNLSSNDGTLAATADVGRHVLIDYQGDDVTQMARYAAAQVSAQFARQHTPPKQRERESQPNKATVGS
jgi:hypothetical protein